MKLGKKPARTDRRDLKFSMFRKRGVEITVPSTFGHERAVREWLVLGNDQYGDCVFAGAAHETMLWNSVAGREVTFSDASVLEDYGAVTGFSPSDALSDQGTNVRDALNYRRQAGIADASGQRHKIAAYLALEPGNYEHLLEALYICEAVGIGIEFPATAMDQFARRRSWKIVPGASIEGGHYVPLVARRSGELVCVTWGRTQRMTRSFYERYCDEAYALVSAEMLDGNGKTAENLDMPSLREALSELA